MRTPSAGLVAVFTTLVVASAACGGSDAPTAAARSDHRGSTTTIAPTTGPSTTTSAPTSTPAPTTTSAPTTTAGPTTTAPPAAPAPLAGRTVLVDPGHNGGNARHASEINRKVNIGNAMKECDTTGTATASGYSEAEYTLDVANRLSMLLAAAGAKVVMTRSTNDGVGPCIDQRAGLGNLAAADVAISIHADSAPASGRGFHVIEPAPVAGYNEAIVAPSVRFGHVLRQVFAQRTGVPPADYIARDGEVQRSDLGGLNLSKVPKVFIETGNMANATDVALLADPAFRQQEAAAIAEAVQTFLTTS